MLDMTTIADRLLTARRDRGLSQQELGEAAKVTKQTISAIERGKTQKPDHDTVVAICRELNLNAQWLLTGRGPREPSERAFGVREPNGSYVLSDLSGAETPPGYVRLPLLNMEGDMGSGAIVDEEPEVVRFIDVADWWAQQHLPRQLSRIKIVSSRGDSMAGVINHGDIVFVDTSISHYDGEGIYVFNWQGRALIKRLAPNLRTGNLQILSANSAYPPEDVPVAEIDQLHIAGRVVAWWTLKKH